MRPQLLPRPLPSLPLSLPLRHFSPTGCACLLPSSSPPLGCLRSPRSTRLPSDPKPRPGTPHFFPALAYSFLGLRHTLSPLISLLEFAPSPPPFVRQSLGSNYLPPQAAAGKKVAGSPPVTRYVKLCQGPVGVSGGTVPLGWTPLGACALAPTIPPWTSTAPTHRLGRRGKCS